MAEIIFILFGILCICFGVHGLSFRILDLEDKVIITTLISTGLMVVLVIVSLLPKQYTENVYKLGNKLYIEATYEQIKEIELEIINKKYNKEVK